MKLTRFCRVSRKTTLQGGSEFDTADVAGSDLIATAFFLSPTDFVRSWAQLRSTDRFRLWKRTLTSSVRIAWSSHLWNGACAGGASATARSNRNMEALPRSARTSTPSFSLHPPRVTFLAPLRLSRRCAHQFVAGVSPKAGRTARSCGCSSLERIGALVHLQQAMGTGADRNWMPRQERSLQTSF